VEAYQGHYGRVRVFFSLDYIRVDCEMIAVMDSLAVPLAVRTL